MNPKFRASLGWAHPGPQTDSGLPRRTGHPGAVEPQTLKSQPYEADVAEIHESITLIGLLSAKVQA